VSVKATLALPTPTALSVKVRLVEAFNGIVPTANCFWGR
jgi:hypothetical protein